MLHLFQIPAQLKVEPKPLSSIESKQSHMRHATLAGTAFIGEGSQMLLPSRGGGGGEEEGDRKT